VGCGREGSYICKVCQSKLREPEQICPMCLKPSLDGWVHPRCRTSYGIERVLIGLPYRGVVQSCLKKVKYKSAWEIMSFLYDMCTFPDLKIEGVTSVPMWRKKELVRGFNQADILAKLVSADYKVTNLVTLTRVRDTKPQYGLKKDERRDNVEGAFQICKQQTANYIQHKRVILVDDVWTTGATMRECAKILKKSGVKEVWGLTLAR